MTRSGLRDVLKRFTVGISNYMVRKDSEVKEWETVPVREGILFRIASHG